MGGTWQSLALWSVLLAATAAGAAWAEQVIDPGVEKLARAWAEPAGGGEWVSVVGSARDSGTDVSFYLVNLTTGRYRLFPAGNAAVVSADGSRAVSVTASPFGGKEIVVEAIDLKGGATASLDLGEWPEGVALSADGRRLAVVSRGICSVLELPSLRSLASARVPSGRWAYEPLFVTPELVRLHPRRAARRTGDTGLVPQALEDPVAAEMDVAKKTVATLATYPLSTIPVAPRKDRGVDTGPFFHLLPSPDLSRVLVLGFGTAHAVRLLDAASGRVLASVDGSEETGRPMGYFLADGRAVVSEPRPGDLRLALFDPDGSRAATVPLPAGTKHVRFGYEPAKGLLAVGLARDLTAEKRDWFLVHLDSGRLDPLSAEAVWRTPWFDAASVPAPGTPASRLAHETGSLRLVLYDPATGAQTPITRGRAAGK